MGDEAQLDQFCYDHDHDKPCPFCLNENDIRDLRMERDKLLQTLATERDAFGKKETEMKAELERATSHSAGYLMDKQLKVDHLEKDRDFWREQAEKLAYYADHKTNCIKALMLIGFRMKCA